MTKRKTQAIAFILCFGFVGGLVYFITHLAESDIRRKKHEIAEDRVEVLDAITVGSLRGHVYIRDNRTNICYLATERTDSRSPSFPEWVEYNVLATVPCESADPSLRGKKSASK